MDPDVAGMGPGPNHEDPNVAGMGPGLNHEDPDVAGGGPGRTNVENSKTHSSASNGIVERGNRSVQGMIRVLKSALENRLKVKGTEYGLGWWSMRRFY